MRQVACRERAEADAEALDVVRRALGEQRRDARADHAREEHERAEHRGVVVRHEHPVGGPEHRDQRHADGARDGERVLQAEGAEAPHPHARGARARARSHAGGQPRARAVSRTACMPPPVKSAIDDARDGDGG